MGADIYLRSVFDPHHDAAKPAFDAAVAEREKRWPLKRAGWANCPEQKAVERAWEEMYAVGYFRDSYNPTNLFWFLGLSWSQNDWIGADCKMDVEAMVQLRDLLERPENVVTCDKVKAWSAKPDLQINFAEAGNDLTTWGKMFERKRRRLVKLLGQAIRLAEPLDCSC